MYIYTYTYIHVYIFMFTNSYVYYISIINCYFCGPKRERYMDGLNITNNSIVYRLKIYISWNERIKR